MSLTAELQIVLSHYSGSIDASTANYLLDYAKSPEDLRAIIDKIDTNTHGSLTITYSGGLDGLDAGSVAPWSNEVAGEFAKRPDLKVLDNTEAFKFLDVLKSNGGVSNNKKLYDKLGEVFGDSPNDRGSKSNQFLFGNN